MFSVALAIFCGLAITLALEKDKEKRKIERRKIKCL